MKASKTPFLIGAAAIAAIGLAGAAMAQIKHSRVLQVRLPEGTLEEIRYAGDTPPVVRLQPGWAPTAYAWPADTFGPDSPFVALERISAQMDREAAALMRQARSLPGPLLDGSAGLTEVDLGKLPPGISGYSVVSTLSGGKVCTRTVRYGPSGGSGGLASVSRASGDCDDAAKASPSAQAVSAPASGHQPLLQQVSARF
jgi:hypothetical protein